VHDVSGAPFEIEPLPNFLDGLIESVCDLGRINLRDDIKGVLLSHLTGEYHQRASM
jgi:hypothetical protein